MSTVVIGLGETGGPLFQILKENHDYVYGGDKKSGMPDVKEVEFLHICIPYSDGFVESVKAYQEIYTPKYTIIHSTVPIGTTEQFDRAVHSPILGKHGGMKESIKSFTKWIGGSLAGEVERHFTRAGIHCRVVSTSRETEALKLLCLAKYGMSIVFADYCDRVAKAVGFDYSDILEWDYNYNAHVAEHLKRPIITPPHGRIGGHCVLQNSKILQSQHPNKIVKEITKYDS